MPRVGVKYPVSPAPPVPGGVASSKIGYIMDVLRRSAHLPALLCGLMSARAVNAAPDVPATASEVATAAPAPNAPSAPDALFAPRFAAPRPVGAARPSATAIVCSPRVCVHAEDAAAAEGAERALTAAEAALDMMLITGLPAPLPDGGRGGSLALDVYLGAEAPRRAEAIPDGLWPSPFDRSAAFARVRWPLRGPACALELAATEAVLAAAWVGLDAAPSPAMTRAHARYVAQQWQPCPALLAAEVDHAQRRPEVALLDLPAPLLGWFLEDRYGVGPVGTLSTSLWAIGAQPAPRGNHHVDEPDLFDVLRRVMPYRHKTLGETLLQLAIARAFMGSRSDGQHLRDSDWLGDLGRVRFDWRVDYASLPRRLAPPRPLAPTGASYIWVDLDQAKPDQGLVFHARWEESHVFQWALVRIDAEGRSIGAHLTGGIFGNSEAVTTIETLGGAAALLVVGVHVGNDNRRLAYDPDVGPSQVTSYEVTLHPKSP